MKWRWRDRSVRFKHAEVRGIPVGGTGRPRRWHFASWTEDDSRARVEREAMKYEERAEE